MSPSDMESTPGRKGDGSQAGGPPDDRDPYDKAIYAFMFVVMVVVPLVGCVYQITHD